MVLVSVAPVTSISQAVSGGNVNDRVDVYNDGSVASDGGPGGFEAGQTVAIGAGTDHVEIRTITGFGSLIIDQPLEFDHAEGEVIVVVETAPVAADSDGDGVIDREDEAPGDPNETLDSDNDGIGNNADTYDDDDGYSDEDEALYNSDPLDPFETSEILPCDDGIDDDGDGLYDLGDPDCTDANDPLEAPDADGDLVEDDLDNCVQLSNPLQEDTDGDGYGNACDCDFDQNLACSIADFSVFREDYITTVDRGVGTDMDGNGAVSIADFSLFRAGYVAGVPGPSGLAP